MDGTGRVCPWIIVGTIPSAPTETPLMGGRTVHCSMTNRNYPDVADGIWDDGEWISWEWINQQIDDQELQREYPLADVRVVRIFEDLCASAAEYYAITQNYLQIWGELGELFAEIRFGLKRHRARAEGSDGKIGNDFVEVKTISPEKKVNCIHVKRSGHFNKLLVVKINEHFEFEAKLIDRRSLGRGPGKRAKFVWPTDDPLSRPDSEQPRTATKILLHSGQLTVTTKT